MAKQKEIQHSICSTTINRNRNRKRSKPNWADLQPDLIDYIFSKLSFINIFRCKAVCTSWRRAALLRHQSLRPTVPLLMLPPESQQDKNTASVCFFSLEDKAVYDFLKLPRDVAGGSCCVGSSCGWLVFLDRKSNPYLLNLFSRTKIQLPPLPALLKPHSTYCTYCDIPRSLIVKAVLSANPSCREDYAVVIIYAYDIGRNRIALFRQGDRAWTDLEGDHNSYCDILCHKNNELYALDEGGEIELWDLQKSVKIRNIHPRFPSKFVEYWRRNFPRDLYSRDWYLVESGGDVLLVVRYVGEFVLDGKAVYEAELYTEESTQPLVGPYRTMGFQVYKLINFTNEEEISSWEEIGTLKDRVLFIGGSQAKSVSAKDHPECKGNSIYFTDNYWDRMNEDYSYGGHDMGVFSMEDGNIEPFHDFGWEIKQVKPPPFWVLPDPCQLIHSI